ncbi:MAG TPA: tail fiber domain-containing protein [Verrucomicrobiae bacterium]
MCGGSVYSQNVLLTSDRNAKERFAPVRPQEVLARVAALPVSEWNYKNDSAQTRHMGPMAQDFRAAFSLNGPDDKHIASVDEAGVALAAIQGLNEQLKEKQKEIDELAAEVEELKKLVEKK